LELGCGGGQVAAAIARLIEQLASVAQEFVYFGEAGAELFGFELQQTFAGLRGVALGFEVGGVLGELFVLRFPLEFFCSGRFDLLVQRVHALAHLGEQ
jgi:SAM-dependent methyltransferase